MTQLNNPQTRTMVFYISAFVVTLAAAGSLAAYFGTHFAKPPTVVGDPIKSIGTGDAPSQNPVVLDGVTKESNR
jgi:hypothetical protein